MNELESILLSIETIILKSEAEKAARLQRGELFNIFDVLNVSNYEVTTHSAFLCELFDTKGSHGLGNYPLSELLQIVNRFKQIPFDISKAVVHKELYIGVIDDNYDSGGRIDILIESGTSAIVIENKIHHGDERKQLLRYTRYAKKYGDNYVLLYLTLDGHSPTDYSIKDDFKEQLEEGKDFWRISYKDDIVSILQSCVHQAFDKPLIRETIIQYINLIKELTHNDMDNQSKKELVDLMLKHPDCISQIFDYRDDYINEAVTKHFIPQLEKIAENHNLIMGSTEDFLTKAKYVGINFWDSTWKNSIIRIECDYADWREVFIGVVYNNGNKKGEKNPFSIMEGSNNYWYGGWKYLNPRDLNHTAIPAILAGDSGGGLYEQIDNIIGSIIEEIKQTGRDM